MSTIGANKLKQVSGGGSTVTTEITTGTTHSLTTIAGQKVLVIVKGQINYNSDSVANITVSYNTVQKDVVQVKHETYSGTTYNIPFTLQYTETPGAATQDITVAASYGSLSNVVIMVMKIG